MQPLSIALTSLIILIPAAAQAQQWQTPWHQQQQYPGEHWQSLPPRPPVSREHLNQLNQLGGGQDQYGTYNQPVPVRSVFDGDIPDGSYRFPMQWDPDRSILLQIQDGQIRRQDYVLPR
ncbi:hypothetical protein [Leptolyngbya sp. ST-U4]|uniref:hypothetical protein n=1 Tax=Leptolyngbya sp. ST-U4 TaxID=2933912 RepID=UPI0032995054